MKLYGHLDERPPTDKIVPEALAEVTIVATPDELRKIATFLNAAALSMEAAGNEYNHEHLADSQDGFESSPQLIVFNPEFSG